MIVNQFTTVPAPVREGVPVRATLLLGLLAGVLNGLFGTGGGMVLTLGLARLFPGEEAENLSISTASVLVFFILSTILYAMRGHIAWGDTLGIVPLAALGGAFGALLLGRLAGWVLTLLLSLMLLFSGVMLLC